LDEVPASHDYRFNKNVNLMAHQQLIQNFEPAE
jgi:hypothetical protein